MVSDAAAGAASGCGQLPSWLSESSPAGLFPASSCRSNCRISPCSTCIASTATLRALTDSAEA
nr:hypothetical protein Itr_chr08CG08260 [Ipomoea trifida]